MGIPPLDLAHHIADFFSPLPQVEAIALGGSRGPESTITDLDSDIDLYVYTTNEIPLDVRRSIMERSGGASRSDLGLEYWGPGDEWFNRSTGIEIDVIYFDTAWMDEQIHLVVDECRPSLGYTTCLWYTLANSTPFHDRNGWFSRLQARCKVNYPEALRRNIVRHNHPVLRSIIPAYTVQLDKAVKRQDEISINHRLAGLFASYFDILFAVNRRLHPGEKRLVEYVLRDCARYPLGMQADIHSIFQSASARPHALHVELGRLLDRLDDLLVELNFEI